MLLLLPYNVAGDIAGEGRLTQEERLLLLQLFAIVIVCVCVSYYITFLVHAQERSSTRNAVLCVCVCVSMDQWGGWVE